MPLCYSNLAVQTNLFYTKKVAMKVITSMISFLLFLQLGTAQTWQNSQKLRAESPNENDKYGVSVARNAEFTFVGASLDDESEVGIEDESSSNGGAVYLYDNSTLLVQKIFPSLPMKSAYFGNSIAADEQNMVIGAYYGKHDTASTAKEGLAYIFNYDADLDEWLEHKVLKHQGAASYDLFGRDVAIDGDYVLVSASSEDEGENSSGAGYIFAKNEGGSNNWGQQAKLKANTPQASAHMGWAADMHNGFAILGAYKYDTDTKEDVGAAYIFKQDDNIWTEQQILIPNGSIDSKAGYDVAIHNNYALVSAPYESVNDLAEAGVVYLYQLNDEQNWALIHTFQAQSPETEANFGYKVDINEHYIAITSKAANNNKGLVDLYTINNNGNWTPWTYSADENFDFNELGTSVSLYKNACVIGASHGTASEGAAYIANNYIFEQIASDIPNYHYPAICWGDYDNDGDQDLAISGALDVDEDFFGETSAIDIYQNNNGIFSAINTPDIYGLHLGAIQFADIDLDGDLDFIATGQNYEDILTYPLSIYTNNNGNFTSTQELSGSIYSSVNTGDYDNDGDLDILLSGAYQSADGAAVQTIVYNNNNGVFENSNIALTGVQNGDAQFADFDNDKDLDILLMGTDVNDDYILHVYSNNNGEFELTQELGGMYLGAFALADYDNDNDIDFAIMGDDTNDDYAAFVYNNNNGVFELAHTLEGIDNSSGYSPIAWGDYDNDGLRDLMIAGTDINYDDVTHLYHNQGDAFVKVDEGVKNLGGSTALAYIDIDNDNDLDALVSGFYSDADFNYTNATVLHKNHIAQSNENPNPPTALNATIDPSNSSITFEWTAANDDRTASEGLYYWFELKDAQTNKLLAAYTVYSNSWTLNIPANNYLWSVQAIDASHAYSDKAEAEITVVANEEITLEDASIRVFPNPSPEALNISSLKRVQQATIYDAKGKIMLTTYNSHQIDLSGLSSGQYFMDVTLANGELKRLSFLKI